MPPYEVRFKCPCPNIGCEEDNKLKTWNHGNNCGGDLYLTKYGKINCKRCGDNYHIFDSVFKCSREKNYGQSDITKICGAIAAVGQMDDGTSEMSQFCDALLDELYEEKRKRKNK